MTTTTVSTNLKKTLTSLLLVLFIDGLGQGLLFPILAQVLSDPNNTQLLHSSSIALRDLSYGIIIGIFFLTAFIGATVLGDISDCIGRRKALIICLLGSSVGYIFCVLALVVHSVGLMILGRVIDGFTSGSQSVAAAAIIDGAPSNQKARYIGYNLFALSIGIAAGPVIGGLFSDPHIVPWFNNRLPLYIAIILSLINILLLQRYFKETLVHARRLTLSFKKAFQLLWIGLRDPSIRSLTPGYFLVQTAFNGFYIFSSMFIANKFHLSSISIGLYVGLIGIGLALGFGVLVKPLEGKAKNLTIAVCGYGIMGGGIFFAILAPNIIWLWCLVIPTTAAFGVAFSFLSTEYSNRVSTDNQGQIMGILGGVSFLAIGFISLLNVYLELININGPFIFAGCAALIGSILLWNSNSTIP